MTGEETGESFYRGEYAIGALTVPFGQRKTFPQIAKWLGEQGCRSVSIAAWQPPEAGVSGRGGEDAFVAAHFGDLKTFDESRASEMKGAMAEAGITPISVAYYENMSTADVTQRRAFHEQYSRACRAARMIGAKYVGTFPGRNETMGEKESLGFFIREIGPDVQKRADDEGRVPVWENCIMEGLLEKYGLVVGNVAYCPENWREILGSSGTDKWRMVMDPSHLIWEGIDPIRALREFGPSIVEVHAKDAGLKGPRFRPPETRNMKPLPYKPENYETGIVKDNHPVKKWGAGLYHHAVPGLGDVKWKQYLWNMRESGLVVPVTLEIEDEVFNPRSPGLDNYGEAAFRVGIRTLKPYCAALK